MDGSGASAVRRTASDDYPRRRPWRTRPSGRAPLRGFLRTLRYARNWKSGCAVHVEEIEILREGVRVPATLLLPREGSRSLPGWIAVGGISRLGRFHPQLMRFANALAASGAAVLVPEVPEWRRLRLSPEVTGPTVRACLEALAGRPEVRPGKVGLIGFSFGAPHVAVAAAQEGLADRVAGVVMFGAYCSLERTLVCQLTGEHEWKGADHRLNPDPYGRWIVASNHLTDVPGHEDATDVATALNRLACAASGQRISAWDPHHDDMIRTLRAALPQTRRGLFDLFATPTTASRADRHERVDMARRLAAACGRVEPLLAPEGKLETFGIPTRLIHGRGDRLIPYTESLRLTESLPSATSLQATITGLFNHSADHSPASFVDRAQESMTFFGALRGVINTV